MLNNPYISSEMRALWDYEQSRLAADDLDISCTLDPDGCFRAIDRNNYDVDCDHTGFFTRSPTGYGRTPLDAIIDLLDETDERAGR